MLLIACVLICLTGFFVYVFFRTNKTNEEKRDILSSISDSMSALNKMVERELHEDHGFVSSEDLDIVGFDDRLGDFVKAYPVHADESKRRRNRKDYPTDLPVAYHDNNSSENENTNSPVDADGNIILDCDDIVKQLNELSGREAAEPETCKSPNPNIEMPLNNINNIGSLRFTDRNCAVDKQGNVYTEEKLQNQIR